MSNHIPEQVFAFIKASAPFDDLADEELQALCRRIQVIYLNRENAPTLLQRLQPALFLIASGEFTVTDPSMDATDKTRHLSSGDYFGYSNLLPLKHQKNDEEPNSDDNLQIDSENPGLVYVISREDFQKHCQQNSNFIEFFQRMHNRALHLRHSNSHDRSESVWLHQSLEQYCHRPPISISGRDTIACAAKKMSEHHISSLLIIDHHTLIGIITDRDLRQRVLANDIAPTQTVASVMTSPALAINRDASIFDALVLMSRHNIHHLPIIDSSLIQKPHAVGLISASDLIRQQQGSLLFLLEQLHKATSLLALISASKQIPDYLIRHAQHLGDYDIASHFLAQSGDLIAQKLSHFYQQEFGPAPCQFAWVNYGSQARREPLLSSDQDNGLLLERELEPDEAEYFSKFSDYICQGLAQCGQVLCPGNIMASNAALRLTAPAAIAQSAGWVHSPNPDAVLKISIFLDIRYVFGDESLVQQVQAARARQVQAPIFLASLARDAQNSHTPLTIFQRFVFDSVSKKTSAGHAYKDGINLKSGGINIINSIVRLYAFFEGVSCQSVGTLERLQQLTDQCGLVESDRQTLKDIWLLLQRFRWRHQLQHGLHNNSIRLSDLSSFEQHQLKAAFKAIQASQSALLLKFSAGGSH